MPSERASGGFHDQDNQFSHTRASSGDTEDFTNDPRYRIVNQVHQQEEHGGDKRTSVASIRSSEHPILYYSEHSRIHDSKRKRPEPDESDGSRSPRAQRQRVNGVSDPQDNAYDQPLSIKEKIGLPWDGQSNLPLGLPRRSYSLATVLNDEPGARNAERHNRLPRRRDHIPQGYGDHVERGLRGGQEEDALANAQAKDFSELPPTYISVLQYPSPYLISGPSGLSAQSIQELLRPDHSPVLSTVSDGPPCFTLSSVVAIARDKRTSVACKYCRKRKIRCGGPQSGSEERCKNCSKLNRECIFAPASPISLIAVTPHPSRSAGGPLGRTMYGPSAQPPPSNSTGLCQDTQPPRSLYNGTSLTPTIPYPLAPGRSLDHSLRQSYGYNEGSMGSSLQPRSTGSGNPLERSHTTSDSDIQGNGLSVDAPSNSAGPVGRLPSALAARSINRDTAVKSMERVGLLGAGTPVQNLGALVANKTTGFHGLSKFKNIF
ncbi:hypothetical protein VDGL01_08350 [Verticillium dahliae]